MATLPKHHESDEYFARMDVAKAASSRVLDRHQEIQQLTNQNLIPGDDVDVNTLESTVSLVSFMFSDLAVESYARASEKVRDRQLLTDDFFIEIDRLLQMIVDLLSNRSMLDRVDSLVVELHDQIRAAVQRARGSQLAQLGYNGATQFRDEIRNIDSSLITIAINSELTRAVTRANDAAEKAVEASDKASTAAGTAGEAALSSFYAGLARTEGDAAEKFRIWTIWTGVAAGLTAVVFLVVPEFGLLKIESSDFVHLIQRILVSAAAFGMAGYFARQAHHHRSLANWAGALAVQLQTFEAYLAPIEDQTVRDELRKSFAQRAFGDHPAMKGEPSVTPTAAAMENTASVVAKLVGK